MPEDNENNGSTDPTGQQTPPPADPAKSEAKFTQADLDRVIAERLPRAKTAAETDLLKKLGAATSEEAADLIKKAREFEESQKTEQERLQGAVDTEKNRADQLQAERDALNERLTNTVRNGAVVEALKAEGVNDSDVALLLINQGDTSGFLTDDKPDTVKIKAAVAELKKTKPYLFASANYKGFQSLRDRGNPDPAADAAQTAREAHKRLLRRGRA